MSHKSFQENSLDYNSVLVKGNMSLMDENIKIKNELIIKDEHVFDYSCDEIDIFETDVKQECIDIINQNILDENQSNDGTQELRTATLPFIDFATESLDNGQNNTLTINFKREIILEGPLQNQVGYKNRNQILDRNHLDFDENLNHNYCNKNELSNSETKDTDQNAVFNTEDCIKLRLRKIKRLDSSQSESKKKYSSKFNADFIFYDENDDGIFDNEILQDSPNFSLLRKNGRNIETKNADLEFNNGNDANKCNENTKTKFICTFCKKKIKTKLLLSRHCKIHILKDTKTVEVENNYICGQCGKMFKTNTTLKNHLVTHGEKRFFCNFCDKGFYKRNNLKFHKNLHLNIKPFKCVNCDKAYYDSSSLTKHSKLHLPGNESMFYKPFKCDICNKNFSQKSHLNVHKKVHFNQFSTNGESATQEHLKFYQCEYCNKRFNYKMVLIEHIRMHTGQRPLSCHLCKKSFGYKTVLRKHILRHNKKR